MKLAGFLHSGMIFVLCSNLSQIQAQTAAPTAAGQTAEPTVAVTAAPTAAGQTSPPTAAGQTPEPTAVGQTPEPTVAVTAAPTVFGQTPAPSALDETPSPSPAPSSPKSEATDITESPTAYSAQEVRIRLSNTNLCLNVPNSLNRQRNQLRLWDCNLRDNQRFVIGSDGFVTSVLRHEKCVSIDGPSDRVVHVNDPIRMYDCISSTSAESITQKWKWASSTRVNGRVGKLKSQWKRRFCARGGEEKGDIVRIAPCRIGGHQGKMFWVIEHIDQLT